MTKILFIFGIIVAALAGAVLGLSVFLSPNDFGACDERPNDTEKCQAADVIIAVSGGDTMARAKSAVQLYKNNWAKQIIFSGAARDPKSQSNAAAMRDLATKSGVNRQDIIIEENAKTTLENAENTAKILKKRGVKTAILTTSPYHMRRVLWEFKRAAPDVEFRSRPAPDQPWNLWFIKPAGWWRAISELGGLIMFGIRGAV